MRKTRSMVCAAIAACGACGLAPGFAGVQARAAEQPALVTDISTVDELLDALESSGADLRALSARVQYTRTFAIAGDTQTRQGQLFYEVQGAAADVRKRFAVRFETLILQGGRVENEVKEYVFDGEWFVERTPGTRQFVKRQVVPPGERFDPLKVGEGPFPLPIGQKRADILAEYEASIRDATDGLNESLAGFVSRDGGTYRLRLIPHDPNAAAKQVEVWYRKDTLLPRLARTISAEGDESFVQMVDVRQNSEASIDARIFDTNPPRGGRGWDVRIEPWRGGGE